mgnify:CR=1 FL=1
MFDYLAELGLPEEVVSFFFTFFVGAVAVSAVIGIAIYLLESISVYKMAKSAEIKNPWLAFVPVANDWVFGTLAEKYKKKNGTKSARFGIILPVLEGIVLIEAIALTIFTVISVKEITGYALDAVNTSAEMVPEQFMSLIPVIILYFALIAVAISYAVVFFIALWRVYSSFDKSNATLYIVLSVIFTISVPIILFIIRNRKPEFDPHNNIPYFSGTFQG